MNKTIEKLGNTVMKTLTKITDDEHKPVIFAVITVVGAVSATILAAKAAPKVKESRVEAAEKLGRQLNAKEEAKIHAKFYWPVLMALGISITGTILSTRLSKSAIKRVVAQTAMEKGVEKAFEKAKEGDPTSADKSVEPASGSVTIIDGFSGRKFKSSIEHIEKCIELLNSELVNREDREVITVNDVYEYIGLDEIEAGYTMGWIMRGHTYDGSYHSDGCVSIGVEFDAVVENGVATLVMHFMDEPTQV